VPDATQSPLRLWVGKKRPLLSPFRILSQIYAPFCAGEGQWFASTHRMVSGRPPTGVYTGYSYPCGYTPRESGRECQAPPLVTANFSGEAVATPNGSPAGLPPPPPIEAGCQTSGCSREVRLDDHRMWVVRLGVHRYQLDETRNTAKARTPWGMYNTI